MDPPEAGRGQQDEAEHPVGYPLRHGRRDRTADGVAHEHELADPKIIQGDDHIRRVGGYARPGTRSERPKPGRSKGHAVPLERPGKPVPALRRVEQPVQEDRGGPSPAHTRTPSQHPSGRRTRASWPVRKERPRREPAERFLYWPPTGMGGNLDLRRRL